MKSLMKNFVAVMLLGSAILVAGVSSDAEGKSVATYSAGQVFSANSSDRHNSEFWNKFRESVMPGDKKPSSDFTGNDNPEPSTKKNSDNK